MHWDRRLPFGALPSFLLLLDSTRASAISLRWSVIVDCSVLPDPFVRSVKLEDFFCCTMLKRQLAASEPLLYVPSNSAPEVNVMRTRWP